MAKKLLKSCDTKNCPVCCCGIGSFIIGIGVGALLTYPFFGTHPVKWGIALIAVGLIIALYSKMGKK